MRRQLSFEFDIALVGGGLAACLTAIRLQDLCPELKVAIVEQGDCLGAGVPHTWSFHVSDICRDAVFEQHWLYPFVSKIWPADTQTGDGGYAVIFPQYKQHLPLSYASCRSEPFLAAFRKYFRGTILLNTVARQLFQQQIITTDGRIISAECVFDARGEKPNAGVVQGYQKFVGGFFRTVKPHGFKYPIIMDATVDQIDGYRFVYLLPFSDDILLTEDTYYSLSPKLDVLSVLERIDNYLKLKGVQAAERISVESGVLPIPLEGLTIFGESQSGNEKHRKAAAIGMRGGFFHPTTGYSLVSAVKMADFITENAIGLGRLELSKLSELVWHEGQYHWQRGKFLRRLNSMFFLAGPPDERYKVIQKFYRHPVGLIERFYGNRLRVLDRIRIMSGKPPVPVFRALKLFFAKQELPAVLAERELSDQGV